MRFACPDPACGIGTSVPPAADVPAELRTHGLEYAVQCLGCLSFAFPCDACHKLSPIKHGRAGLLVCGHCGFMEVLEESVRKALQLPPLPIEDALRNEVVHIRAVQEQLAAANTPSQIGSTPTLRAKVSELRGSWMAVLQQPTQNANSVTCSLTMLKLLPSTAEATPDDQEWMASTIESFYQQRPQLIQLRDASTQSLELEAQLVAKKALSAAALSHLRRYEPSQSQQFEALTSPFWALVGKANAQLRRLVATARDLESASADPSSTTSSAPSTAATWANPRSRRRARSVAAAVSPHDLRLRVLAEEFQLWRHICREIASVCCSEQ
ncbi:hypothetical protein SDRG_06741 [Saprolegnia diclina VS20]|uniref:Uncharacterized protein n=1 Tax=Saprolegnia diclina (strain VS20) TaxID=1156394 RepID=T0QMT2_SAPDV|nr:hypothetical protein SDRG_06741 [Saprolegnia diclina VS20]EQC36001.1 hypothetical protein SDRG_06741 [Saprolegnia diclina VS20]|eukprot:XP_008610763.1 hypothetical protein SDRG_06741 [Saprolegnia diclina VS20]